MGTRKIVVRAVLLVAMGLTFCAESTRGESGDPVVQDGGSGVHHGESAMPAFPVEFDVVPANRLYVDGLLIEHVRLTTQEGDSLYLNGAPILPHRPCEKRAPFDDETYARVYGSVPFVRELMETGSRPSSAAKAFNSERSRIEAKLYKLYVAAREAGRSVDAANGEAFAALREIDEAGLIDWSGEVWQKDNTIVVTWKGLGSEEEILFLDPGPEKPKMPSEKEKRQLASRLYELLGRGGAPCWYVMTCGGTTIAVGENDVACMEAHLEEVLATGVATGGALSKRAARELLEREKGTASTQPSN